MAAVTTFPPNTTYMVNWTGGPLSANVTEHGDSTVQHESTIVYGSATYVDSITGDAGINATYFTVGYGDTTFWWDQMDHGNTTTTVESEELWVRLLLNVLITTLFIVSLLGNFLIFAVFSMKPYRQNLTAMLYRILAVVDGLVMVVEIGLYHVSVQVLGYTLSTYNVATCKAFVFITFWLRAVSIWLIVVITTERLICVWWPQKAKTLNTKGRFACYISVIVVITCVLYTPLTLTVDQTGDKCLIFGVDSNHGNGLKWYCTAFNGINLLIAGILPFVLVVSFNSAIIYGTNKKTLARNSPTKKSVRLSSSLTVLLFISSISVVFTLPKPIYYFLTDFIHNLSSEAIQQIVIFWYSIPVFDSVNRSINIFLFCIFGGRFRQCLKKLFSCKKKRPKKDIETRTETLQATKQYDFSTI